MFAVSEDRLWRFTRASVFLVVLVIKEVIEVDFPHGRMRLKRSFMYSIDLIDFIDFDFVANQSITRLAAASVSCNFRDVTISIEIVGRKS